MQSIQFITIVFNGKPFIQQHLPQLLQLSIPWHWHIVEGVAEQVHDSGWWRAQGGTTDGIRHAGGLSTDGTSEYLDAIARKYPERVSLYRPSNGSFWEGKLAMVSAPLGRLASACLLWQLDVDELWNCGQITALWHLFQQEPERSAARFFCIFHVGPYLITDSINCYGNHTCHGEWLRVWNYRPGDRWKSHAPPVLLRPMPGGSQQNVAEIKPFSQAETARHGLVFRHLAYVHEEQVAFKERYYGYTGAVAVWRRLQEQRRFPLRLADYFSWVHDDTTVVPYIPPESLRTIMLVRLDGLGDAVLSSTLLSALARQYPAARIVMVCRADLAELFWISPFVTEVISVDLESAADEVYQQTVIRRLRHTRPDLAVHLAWSRYALGDRLVLESGAPLTVAHDGDLCNITPGDKRYADQRYRYLVAGSPRAHELKRTADILRVLGVHGADRTPRINLSAAAGAAARSLLGQAGCTPEKTVAIFVGGIWKGKCYLRYPEAMRQFLRQNGFSVILLGAEKDRSLHDDLLAKLGVPGVNLSGMTTLSEAAALLQACRLAVGIDTGLAHLACAVGTPTAVLVGGYQFGRYFPYATKAVVACLPLSCWQCDGQCRYERAYCVFDLEPAVLSEAAAMALHSPGPAVVVQSPGQWKPPPGGPDWVSIRDDECLRGVLYRCMQSADEPSGNSDR